MLAGIRWRLVAWTMLVVGLILVILAVATYVALARLLVAQVDRGLADRADQAAANPALVLGGPRDFERERSRGIFYLVIDSAGQVLANPQRIDPADLPMSRIGGRARMPVTVTVGNEPVRLIAHPLGPRTPAGTTLIVGQSLAGEERALGLLLMILVAGGIAGIGLSFAGAWFLAGRALVPIELAFRRQQEFVADASHELRTPLTILRSATDLLDRHRAEPLAASGELFDDVRHEIKRLQRLTIDLLTLARSDQGALGLATAPVDLAMLAAEVVRRINPLAEERRVELTLALDESLPPVEVDPDRLRQVLLILLDNALKHTPPGGRVAVSTRRAGDDAVVEVADSGVGIAPEHLPRIFERFYRVDAARSREQGGTGLGLAIARAIVGAHGGELGLTSRVGQGTRVTVRLPIAPAAVSLPARLGDLAARVTHRAGRRSDRSA